MRLLRRPTVGFLGVYKPANQARVPFKPLLNISAPSATLRFCKPAATATVFSPHRRKLRASLSPSPNHHASRTSMSSARGDDVEDAASSKSKVVLYVKAGKDTESLGDCPFSHKVHMALRAKQLEEDLELDIVKINTTDKPGWFLELNPRGTVPVLQYNKTLVCDSTDALNALDELFPPPLLRAEKDSPLYATASSAVAAVFPAFAKYLKCGADSELAAHKESLDAALTPLDEHLQTAKTDFLCGPSITALDCDLAPKLYHVTVAAAHYRAYQVPPQLGALKEYMQRVFNSEPFLRSKYDPEEIIWGWSKFF